MEKKTLSTNKHSKPTAKESSIRNDIQVTQK